jgi:hypothetical protein
MAYGQWPGQNGQQGYGRRGQEPGDDGRRQPPERRYGRQDDTQGLAQRGQRRYDQRGQQAGDDGDGRWQPPEWRYGPQGQDAGNGQQGYAPGQYQPQPGRQPPHTGQRGYGQPFPPPQPPAGPPQPPPRSKSWPARHKVLTGLFAFVALIIIIVAANAGGSPSSGTNTSAGTQPTASAPAAAAAPKATQAAAAAQTVTYEVSGSTADVTYGPAGSTLSGQVPMKVTAKLGSPSYYSVTAQLQGDGSVTVKILVDGTVISSGTATGGYNIATAEISQDPLSGQWTDTNQG